MTKKSHVRRTAMADYAKKNRVYASKADIAREERHAKDKEMLLATAALYAERINALESALLECLAFAEHHVGAHVTLVRLRGVL